MAKLWKRKPKSLVDTWVLEWDPDEHGGDGNPGYGPCAGKVVDPFGKELRVQWADGEASGILRKDVWVTPAEGTTFRYKDKDHIIHYTDGAVHLTGAVTCNILFCPHGPFAHPHGLVSHPHGCFTTT